MASVSQIMPSRPSENVNQRSNPSLSNQLTQVSKLLTRIGAGETVTPNDRAMARLYAERLDRRSRR